MKKKKRARFFVLVIVPVFCIVLVAFAAKKAPGTIFVASEKIVQFASRASVNETTFEKSELKSFSLADLRRDARAVFDQSLLLVNRENPLPKGFEAQIAQYKDSAAVMNRCVMESYGKIAKEVDSRFGEKLFIMSAYRTAEEQQETVKTSGELAQAVGASEHQAGLALDVYVPGYAGKSFIKTSAGQFVNSKCWQFGFIIRYPYYGEEVTGIEYEPWHLRYVGAPHAEIIYKNKLTLEEYFQLLEEGKYYEFKGYIITRQSGESFSLPKEAKNVKVAADNTGGMIFTIEM